MQINNLWYINHKSENVSWKVNNKGVIWYKKLQVKSCEKIFEYRVKQQYQKYLQLLIIKVVIGPIINTMVMFIGCMSQWLSFQYYSFVIRIFWKPCFSKVWEVPYLYINSISLNWVRFHLVGWDFVTWVTPILNTIINNTKYRNCSRIY